MKIDFNQTVKTIGGEFVKLDAKDEKPPTLGAICVFALGAFIHQPGRQMDADEHYKRYRLAHRLEKGGEIELQAADVTLIRKCASESLYPFSFGAVADLIDPPPAG